MAWTVITNAEIDTDSPITESLMTRLRDNLEGAFDKDAGAPVLANNYIVAGMISLGTGTQLTTTTHLDFTMTGGEYCFCPGLESVGVQPAYLYGGRTNVNPTVSGFQGAYLSVMALGTLGAFSVTCQFRYINASPPYDLGDGEVALFAAARLDSNGKIESLNIANDPVWAHNGPTCIVPDYYKNGIGYQRKKIIDNAALKSIDPIDRLAAIREAPIEIIEVDQSVKNADMDLIPHPYTVSENAGLSIVMLDPVCECMQELAELRAGGEDINEIIQNYITIGNSDIGRKGPQGLLIPSIKWKNT